MNFKAASLLCFNEIGSAIVYYNKEAEQVIIPKNVAHIKECATFYYLKTR